MSSEDGGIETSRKVKASPLKIRVMKSDNIDIPDKCFWACHWEDSADRDGGEGE